MDFNLALCGLVTVRLFLAFAPLPEQLKHDHLLSSPLTSNPRLHEGIYLFQNGVDPYSGGVFYQSPLYLSIFSTVLPLNRITGPILWTAVDAIAAWALVQTWKVRSRVQNGPRNILIATFYLFNPYLFLPSLAFSTSSISNMLHVLAIMFASRGRASVALLSLAFLVQFSLSSILLLPPLVLLLLDSPVSRLASPKLLHFHKTKAALLAAEFTGYFLTLILASTVISGGTAWMGQTWGVELSLPDLTPNSGLWWYFFTEMFDHFRPFFLMAFSVHLVIYVLPICIKFQHDPLFATFILTGVFAIFKPYPTLSDPGLFFTMTALFPEIFPYLRYPIVTILLHLHASLLLPLFNHLWLSQGTGNANFFYASTLVFGVANGAGLTDCVWAGLRIAIGEEKAGHELLHQ